LSGKLKALSSNPVLPTKQKVLPYTHLKSIYQKFPPRTLGELASATPNKLAAPPQSHPLEFNLCIALHGTHKKWWGNGSDRHMLSYGAWLPRSLPRSEVAILLSTQTHAPSPQSHRDSIPTSQTVGHRPPCQRALVEGTG
jgi:hypothetical protein